MHVEPLPEHKWLEQLVGDWNVEVECVMGPDQPPMKHTGTETTKSLAVWVQCDGTMPMPDGGEGHTVMTLGYDPAKKRFIGTFIGSMMTHMWVYDGELNADRTALTLDADGPSFTDPAKIAKYQDKITIVSPDHRILTSQFLGDDGQWHPFMTGHYRRKSA